MRIVNSLVLIALSLVSFKLSAQVDIYGIHYYMEESLNPFTEADTSYYYAIFEYHFDNDSLLIFNDSSILFQGILSYNVLYSKRFKIGKVGHSENIFVQINNSPILKLQMMKDKYYIRFILNRLRGVLGIYYSKYPPRYR